MTACVRSMRVSQMLSPPRGKKTQHIHNIMNPFAIIWPCHERARPLTTVCQQNVAPVTQNAMPCHLPNHFLQTAQRNGIDAIRRPGSACTVLILLCSIQKNVPENAPKPKSKIQNPKSKIQNPKSEIQNPKSKIRNPKFAQEELLHKAPKSKIRNPKSKIRNPKSKIQNPKSKIRNPKSKIQNPKSKIQNPKSKIPEIWGGGGLM